MAKAFMRGGYSFRPAEYRTAPAETTVVWRAFRKGDRDFWLADIYPASDGQCWVISQTGFAFDARPSFKEACDLVMARLPREEGEYCG